MRTRNSNMYSMGIIQERDKKLEKFLIFLWQFILPPQEGRFSCHNPKKESKAKWRDFDYSQWKEKNDKFDHETWNRLLDEGMDEAAELGNSDVDAWVDKLCDSRKKADKTCGGSPPFRPNAGYNADGDILEVYLSDEASYAKWLNPQVSVLLSIDTDEVVGFEIWGMKGVREIKELVKWFKDKTGKNR